VTRRMRATPAPWARVHFISGATGLAMGRTAVKRAVLGVLPALSFTQHRLFGWAQGRLLPGRCGLCLPPDRNAPPRRRERPKLVQVQERVYHIIAHDDPRPTNPTIRARHS
jgi:hypothetical protein